MNKKFKIGDCFKYDTMDWGVDQVSDDTETYGAYGTSAHWVTKEDRCV